MTMTATPITGRPIRLGVVGLGTISELMLPPYLAHPEVEVVALCDPRPERLERWARLLPDAATTADLDELLTEAPDVVDVLVPTPQHAAVATQVLEAGITTQLQKPIARDLEQADAILAAARATGAGLRILEDYVFFPPIVKVRDLVAADAIGAPVGVHMKIVNTARGGWDVDPASYVWQVEQTSDGRGILVFDHGWHQFALAVWMFGPIRRVFAWIGATEMGPGFALDAPAAIAWEHESGLRGVLDVTLAPDTYFRSEYYSCDERLEVTGEYGFVRCNRISAQGLQTPSVELYRDGEVVQFHAIADRLDAGFVASTDHMVRWLRGDADPVIDGPTARHVLAALETALRSAREERVLDVTG